MMSLLHVDPATAENYLKRGQARLDAEEAQTKDLEARKRADPTYQAIRDELAAQESARAAAREREAHAQAAAAAGVAEAKIRAELVRIGASGADIDRLTHEAMNQWRLEQAVTAASAPSVAEQERGAIQDYLAKRAAARTSVDVGL
jgi:hypothetical protein